MVESCSVFETVIDRGLGTRGFTSLIYGQYN